MERQDFQRSVLRFRAKDTTSRGEGGDWHSGSGSEDSRGAWILGGGGGGGQSGVRECGEAIHVYVLGFGFWSAGELVAHGSDPLALGRCTKESATWGAGTWHDKPSTQTLNPRQTQTPEEASGDQERPTRCRLCCGAPGT
jgi:hypothetical protein